MPRLFLGAEMNQKAIEQAKAYVKDVFSGDSSGHDMWHTMRVYQMALRIGEEEGADLEVVALASLLHDVDDEKLSPDTTKGLKRARAFMESAGIEEDTQERICQVIEEISFHKRGLTPPSTLEGKVVQDADRLDAMGALGIARAFAFGGSRGRSIYEPEEVWREGLAEEKDGEIEQEGGEGKVEQGENEEERKEGKEKEEGKQGSTVEHFYEKLFLLKEGLNTTTGKRIGRERDAFMHAFLDRFMMEWEGKA